MFAEHSAFCSFFLHSVCAHRYSPHDWLMRFHKHVMFMMISCNFMHSATEKYRQKMRDRSQSARRGWGEYFLSACLRDVRLRPCHRRNGKTSNKQRTTSAFHSFIHFIVGSCPTHEVYRWSNNCPFIIALSIDSNASFSTLADVCFSYRSRDLHCLLISLARSIAPKTPWTARVYSCRFRTCFSIVELHVDAVD